MTAEYALFDEHAGMSQYFEIHPTHPQNRLIQQAVRLIEDGAVIVYPTDSCYAFGCDMDNKQGMERIRRIRQADQHHHFTLVCRDLSEIAAYAKVDNSLYRLLRNHTPGPYTFILSATSEVPRRLQNPKKKTIGIRVPDHPVALALLEALNQPLMSSTLIMPGDEHPLNDPLEIREKLEKQVDLIIDSGNCGFEPTTVIGFDNDQPQLLRQGRGPVDWLEQ